MSDAEGQAAATAAMDQSSFLHMERMLREDTKGVYTIKHMLGRGGMAVVYLAEEAGLARKVALKVLPPELTFGHGVERFKREARTAAALDHPNIIPIYRIGDTGKLFWYAMKFLEGKSLEDLLRERGSLSLDESIEILEQVADALDYAHDHKVIHRDIKPANVMLDNRNRVIVTDFGIAKALSEGKLTATDSVIGTPYFMSPEQGMGKTVSGASDQYSVAVMAYRMLAGHVPFDGESAIDILHKHCMFPAPTLADDAPHLPEHVSNAVARALSKSGDERFLSVHDFVQSMKDPDFRAKEPARPSGATVVMTPADAKKLRTAGAKSSGTNPAGANSGKGRTVSGKQGAAASANDKTVLASSKAAPSPAPKSKMGLVIGAVAVLAIGGVGAWKFGPWSQPAPATSTPAPSPDPAATRQGAPEVAGPSTPPGTLPVDTTPVNAAAGAANPPATNTAAPNPAATKAETKTPPRANTTASQTKAPTRPQTQTAPANTPANTPASTPASTPAPQPVQAAPAAAAAETGEIRIALNLPATIEIDGNDLGERRTYIGRLSLGDHLIRVRKPGHEPITRAVTVKAEGNEILRLTLVPIP